MSRSDPGSTGKGPPGPPRPSFGPELEAVSPAIYGWAALRIAPSLRSRIDAEDVLQEVLCRIMTRAQSYDPTLGTYRAWVFGIARRVLQEAMRKCAREGSGGPRLTLTDLDHVPEEATSMTGRIARDETLRIFFERVDGLEDGDRRLILLRGLEGLEHEEIAGEMGLSTAAVVKRWQRLRERLGEELHTLLSA